MTTILVILVVKTVVVAVGAIQIVLVPAFTTVFVAIFVKKIN